MDYRFVEKTPNGFVEWLVDGWQVQRESDALELVSACGEYRAQRLLLYADNLADDFFHLRTGLAGAVLQKLVNYSIKTAMVLTPELINQGRFREMALEANRGNRHVHFFIERQLAVDWLVQEI
ncbi:MAG TPA: DUF4180 domain-containing protein [Anaerolineaceae bacterium]|nr:DUF4180 domain-containing protein [Anaerolineaceae bacterium]